VAAVHTPYVENISKVYIKKKKKLEICRTCLEPCCSSSYGPVTVSVSCAMWRWCWCAVLVVVTVRRRRGFPFRTCRHLGKKTKKYIKNVPIETHLPLTPSLPSHSLRAAAGVSWCDVVVEWGVWGS
jgi:hypothetical protein